jgi:hypothetical protein
LNAFGGLDISLHRAGLNSSASSPHQVGDRCMLIVERTMEAPPGMYRFPGIMVGPTARLMLHDQRRVLDHVDHDSLEGYGRKQAKCLVDKGSAYRSAGPR